MAGGPYILLHNLTSKPVMLDVSGLLTASSSKFGKNFIYNEIILAICSGDKEFCKYHGQDIVVSINGKVIPSNSSNQDIIEVCSSSKINNLQWFTRQRGGFFMDLINFIMGLLKLVLFIPKLILWVAALILWLIKAALFIFIYATRLIVKDGITGLVRYLILEVFMAPFNLIYTFLKMFVNWVGRNSVQAMWGADNVPDPGEELEPSDRLREGCPDGEKCYKTAEGTIPFSVIIATVLCPPVGVFMEYGITGWFNILICAMLTLVFYFPGLIYALILLYC